MMKQIRLHPIIQSYFEQLESLTHKLILPDESESIHDFRVIYKKLRSVIRLTSTEKKQINIPQKIKSIYRLLGKIRELDLMQQKINESNIIKQALKHKCIELLQQRMYSLHNTLSKIPIEILLDNTYNKIIKSTDKKCSLKTVRKFIALKWNHIKSTVITKRLTDNSIHSIRKELKDIFYIIKLLEKEKGKPWIKKRVPEKKIDQFNKFLNELGNFQDSCNALQLLKILNTIKEKTIQEAKMKWLEEKGIIKKTITEKLKNDYISSLEINL